MEYPTYKPFEAGFIFVLPVTPESSDSSCYFIQNEQLKIKAHNRLSGEVYDTNIKVERESAPETTTDGLVVTANDTVIITDLTERSKCKFVVNNSTLVMPSNGGTRYFYV